MYQSSVVRASLAGFVSLPAMRFLTLLLALATALGAQAPAAPAAAPHTFHVRDYGAKPDDRSDSGQAIRAAIQAAIASGPGAEVVLDAGVYRVEPPAPRETCFSIHQATNLVLRGAGKSTKIIITDPASGGFGFGLGQQVALRDLVLDYDPVPFCQGVIRAVDVETGSFELEVEEGYPTPDAENFLKAVEPDSPHGAALAVRAAKLGHGLADAESIRDVLIEDNEIRDRAGSALFVGGATGVTVRSNRIVAGAQAELRRKGPAILLERSSRVVLTANTVSDPRLGTTAAVEIGANVAPGEAGVRISALETTLDKGARAILDHRLPPRAPDRP